MALRNLAAEMARYQVRNTDIQSLLSCSEKTVTNKIAENSFFLLTKLSQFVINSFLVCSLNIFSPAKESKPERWLGKAACKPHRKRRGMREGVRTRMVEISAIRLVLTMTAIGLACFSLGMSVCNLIYTHTGSSKDKRK